MKLSALIPVLLISLALTSCKIDKTPLTEDQIVYAGKWIANDGSWIHIYNDGTGSLKTGNTSVDGGKATISDEEIKIGLFGINKTFTIDEEPYEEDGVMKMKLSGFVYERDE